MAAIAKAVLLQNLFCDGIRDEDSGVDWTATARPVTQFTRKLPPIRILDRYLVEVVAEGSAVLAGSGAVAWEELPAANVSVDGVSHAPVLHPVLYKQPAVIPKLLKGSGGGRGIRTPEGLTTLTVFKTAAFNRSAIPPPLIYPISAARAIAVCAIK